MNSFFFPDKPHKTSTIETNSNQSLTKPMSESSIQILHDFLKDLAQAEPYETFTRFPSI